MNIYTEGITREKSTLTILLTGPPGTGKSILAMELCHKWTSTYVIDKNSKGEQEIYTKGFSSIFITSESDEIWEEQRAKSFGWIPKSKSAEERENAAGNLDKRIVQIWQTTEFIEYLQEEDKLTGMAPALMDGLSGLFGKKVKMTALAQAIKDMWKENLVKKRIKNHNPSVLAIDSLNTFEPSKRPEIYKRFMSLVDSGPMILLLVVESGSDKHSSEFWEYTSDIVIRLDKTIVSDYLVRTIEIIKARYQSHIWGAHQLKIYTPSNFEKIPQRKKDMTPEQINKPVEDRKRIIDKKKRAHPYHESGGIFIFPSIHYYLSVYKRSSPTSQETFYKTPLKTLESIFTEGFPRGRYIGFIGMRGGHKSHLGYLTLLNKITESAKERALVVSLRDDEGMARKTITRILQNETISNFQLDDLIEPISKKTK